MKDTSLELRYLGTRATQLPIQARTNTISAFTAGVQPLPTFFDASQVPASIVGDRASPTSRISIRSFIPSSV
ncbi:MAG: hypothetical protein DMG96_28865 [Acidobacteria bacterium]|nr:MAG: hypothetical protein DMG96_28865 [Acidobacteriota bacterium]